MDAQTTLPEGNYADLPNGRRIHFLDEGEGPVVVFLHGSGPGASGYSNFKGNYPALVAAGYRVTLIDRAEPLCAELSAKPFDVIDQYDPFNTHTGGLDSCSTSRFRAANDKQIGLNGIFRFQT